MTTQGIPAPCDGTGQGRAELWGQKGEAMLDFGAQGRERGWESPCPPELCSTAPGSRRQEDTATPAPAGVMSVQSPSLQHQFPPSSLIMG